MRLRSPGPRRPRRCPEAAPHTPENRGCRRRGTGTGGPRRWCDSTPERRCRCWCRPRRGRWRRSLPGGRASPPPSPPGARGGRRTSPARGACGPSSPSLRRWTPRFPPPACCRTTARPGPCASPRDRRRAASRHSCPARRQSPPCPQVPCPRRWVPRMAPPTLRRGWPRCCASPGAERDAPGSIHPTSYRSRPPPPAPPPRSPGCCSESSP